MTRRPHMHLRAGDIDSTIVYEQRGNTWVVFSAPNGMAPGATHQEEFPTREKAHEHWLKMCHLYIDKAHHAVPADSTPNGVLDLRDFYGPG